MLLEIAEAWTCVLQLDKQSVAFDAVDRCALR